MYAIRSYYAMGMIAQHMQQVRDASELIANATREQTQARITSYNVCYTKLLRKPPRMHRSVTGIRPRDRCWRRSASPPGEA